MIENKICDKCNGTGRVLRSICDVCRYGNCYRNIICGTDCPNYKPMYGTSYNSLCDRCRGKGGIYWVDQLFEE